MKINKSSLVKGVVIHKLACCPLFPWGTLVSKWQKADSPCSAGYTEIDLTPQTQCFWWWRWSHWASLTLWSSRLLWDVTRGLITGFPPWELPLLTCGLMFLLNKRSFPKVHNFRNAIYIHMHICIIYIYIINIQHTHTHLHIHHKHITHNTHIYIYINIQHTHAPTYIS